VRRLLLSVARLYPDKWRKRYGGEFTALLEDMRPQWTDLFDVLRGGLMAWFTWSKVAGLLALAGLAGAFNATYISQAARWTSGVTLFVSKPDGAAASEGVSEVAMEVLATPSLAAIIASATSIKRSAREVRSIRQSIV
jgi:hypothetical protein